MKFIPFLFFFALVFFSFGQLGRISFFEGQVNGYFYEGVMFFHLIILFFLFRLKPLLGGYRNFKILYLFFAALIVSFSLRFFYSSFFENFVAFLYLLRLSLYFLYFVYGAYYLKQHKKDKHTIMHGILFFMVATILTSIIQYFWYPNLRNLIYLGWDPHLYRMFGLFFDVSVAASLYGLLFFFMYFAFDRFSQNTFIKTIVLSIFFVFLLLTYSRTAYIGFIATMIVVMVRGNRLKTLLFLIIVFIASMFLLPKPAGEGVNLMRTFSIESRLRDYQSAIEIWKKSPVFGYGYNRISSLKVDNNQIEASDKNANHAAASFHSSFLIMLVSAGAVGLSFFLLSLYAIARLHITTQTYILFLSFVSFADNILLHPFILFILIQLLFLEDFTFLSDRRW